MDPVAITLGPLEIRWYAVCILLGLMLGVYLAVKEAPRKKILQDDILDFILIAFPLSIIGARIYYVAFSWSDYKDNILSVFCNLEWRNRYLWWFDYGSHHLVFLYTVPLYQNIRFSRCRCAIGYVGSGDWSLGKFL